MLSLILSVAKYYAGVRPDLHQLRPKQGRPGFHAPSYKLHLAHPALYKAAEPRPRQEVRDFDLLTILNIDLKLKFVLAV